MLFLHVLTAAGLLVMAGCGDGKDAHTPRAVEMRLDGMWLFAVDSTNTGIEQRWYADDIDRSAWDSARVPGLWDGDGLETYDGAAWYVRNFELMVDTSLRYAIVFDGVDDNAEVWINGQQVGSHLGHAQRFFFDITAHLRTESNLLAVRIEDVGGPGGILGSVRLRSYTDPDELLRSEYHDRAPVRSPDWVRDAVIYEIYPRSFSPEGTLRGIQHRLPELKQLGVTVLWLMPVHPVGVVKRKGSLGSPYAVRDFHAINPEYGTLDDMRALVAAAHAQGLRVIIDLVANHTAWDNPLIETHPEWYTHNTAGEIIAPNPDWSDVADLNYEQPALRRWMIDMMLYWVREIGIDGFRCDVAELVPTDFWVAAARELRAVKEVMLLAEGSTPELHIDAFDLTYAWNTYDPLRDIIAGAKPADDLSDILRREFLQYPVDAPRLRFSTNHDKHFYDGAPVTLFTPEGAAAAAVLMHTLPGVPLIYNGQETGSRVPMSLFERQPIDWSRDEHGFRALYTALNAARAAYPVLRRGGFEHVPTPSRPGLFLFVRTLGSERALVAVNLGKSAGEITIRDPELAGFSRVLGTCAYSSDRDKLGMKIPAFGYFLGVKTVADPPPAR